MRNFLWCYYRDVIITSLAFEKCKKECNILEIILVQGFCPLKSKITQFHGGFCLNKLHPKSLTNMFFVCCCSLGIIYSMFTVANWLAPSFVGLFGPRVSMIVGGICYA